MYTSKTEQQCMCVRLPGLERRVREHLRREARGQFKRIAWQRAKEQTRTDLSLGVADSKSRKSAEIRRK
jgi:hypothetical protein